MAARPRTMFPIKADPEQENARVAAAKGLAKPLTKRPALNDIDRNRVQQTGGLLVKGKATGLGFPSIKPLASRSAFVNTKRPALKVIKPKECKKPQEVQPEERSEPAIKLKQDEHDDVYKEKLEVVDEDEVKEDQRAEESPEELFEDPDADVRDNPQLVPEYCADIFNYLLELELQYPIRNDFLRDHKSTASMRFVLVSWLVQVHQNFKLCLETLYLAVSYTDRYLQVNRHIGRETLQLVGTAALFLACKYEEVFFPELNDFVYICDDAFSRKQILAMEIDIMKKLDFRLCSPAAITFLRRASKIGRVDQYQHALAKYLLELILVDYGFCHVRPSVQAAAASCLASSIMGDETSPADAWTPALAHHTTHKYSEIEPYVIQLAHLLVKAEMFKNKAVKEKYATTNHFMISVHPKLQGELVKKLTSGKAA